MKDRNLYINIAVFWLLVSIVFFSSSFYRYYQFQVWKAHPKVYFTDKYPAMTTLDAYHWLRYAKEYKNGTYYKSKKDVLRAYPYGTHKPDPVPMISFIIAWVSKIFGSSIYMSGLMIIPLFASLFIIPLALYGWESGVPIAGIVGGFVGSFSWMYAIRTAMGRVDTDLLQLFFLFTGSLLVLKVAYEENTKRRYIYSALLGLNFLFFGWWYGHIGIDLIYLVVLVFMLLIRRVGIAEGIISVLIFAVFANPIWVIHSFSGLIDFIQSYGKVRGVAHGDFPNIMKTITETEHISVKMVLSYMLSLRILDIIGLLLAVVSFFFLRWRAIPILPVFLLGLLSFRSSNRMVMFLGPFVGFGFGFLLDAVLGKFLGGSKKETVKIFVSTFATLGVIGGLVWFTAFKFVPMPSIASPIVKSFEEIKDKVHRAVIFSWWDYGYAMEDIGGFATYHDGGVHGGARTYLVAKALISDNQTLMYHIISFMDSYGVKPIMSAIKDNRSTANAVKLAFDYNKPIKDKDNYVLFTEDMIGKYYAISYLGSWDFGINKSFPSGYSFFACFAVRDGRLICRNGIIDLRRNKGLIDNEVPIKKLVYVIDGHITRTMSFGHKRGVYVEMIGRAINGRLDISMILVCNKKVFDSNFNKMFILGEYNHKLFKEVYNNFPFARLFKVR